MIELRNYQQNVIDDIAYEFKLGKNKICATLPCGAGKTILSGWMARATALNYKRVIFMVHRQELIDQTSATFTAMNINHGVITTGSPKEYELPVQVASVQTLVKRLNEMPTPDFIICDECHHVVANTYKKIINNYPEVKVLGVTATPERLGGYGLGDVFESMVIGPTVKQLISWGNLTPYQYYAPPAKFNADEVRIKFGEFVKSDLEIQLDNNAVVGDIIANYKKVAAGMRAICYCVNRKHSEHVAQCFNAAGIKAIHVDGETHKSIRNQAIRDFRDNKIKILCNAELFGEGFDVPAMEAVILARPTQSLTLFIQQSMRAMRPDPDNPNKTAVIIDHVGNCFRHGMPDDDREWSLETKKKKQTRTISVKTCPQCYTAHYSNVRACPSCGFTYPIASSREELPDSQNGELVKIEAVEKKQQRQEVGRARTIQDLERIAIKRGYSMRWVTRMAELKRIRRVT